MVDPECEESNHCDISRKLMPQRSHWLARLLCYNLFYKSAPYIYTAQPTMRRCTLHEGGE